MAFKLPIFPGFFLLCVSYQIITGGSASDISPCVRCEEDTQRICCSNKSLTVQKIPSQMKNIDGITHLYMAINKIDILDDSFPNVKDLIVLDVSSNDISHISDNFFSEARNMKELYLYNNKLTSLPASMLENMTSLEVIHLYNNDLPSIDPQIFYPIKSIAREIFVCNNKLSVIPRDQMTNLKTIEKLFLFNNNISQLSPGAFRGIKDNINVIHIFSNKFGTILGSWFEGMEDKLVQLGVNEWNAPTFELDHRLAESVNHTGVICESNCTNKANCSCQFCKVGTYGQFRKPGCTQCPAGGFYQDQIGQYKVAHLNTGCKPCSAGTYFHPNDKPGVDPLKCEVCPLGTQTDRNAGFRGCYCLINTFRMGRFKDCTACPDNGITCENEYQEPKPGHWWSFRVPGTDENAYADFAANLDLKNDEYSLSTIDYDGILPHVHVCPTMKNCKGGPRGSCREGHTGPLCGVCLPGYYATILSCTKCPSKVVAIIQLVVIVIALVLLVLLIMKDRKKAKGRNRTLADILLARLKIIIGFYQVTAGVFDAFSYVKWPDTISEFGSYAKFLQMNVLQIASFNCLDGTLSMDAYSDFTVGILANVSVCLLCLLYYLLKKIIVSSTSRHHPEKLAKSLSDTKMICYRNMFLFLFVSYPSTSAKIIQLLPGGCKRVCFDKEKKICPYFLRADYSLECYKGDHDYFVLLSKIMMVYPVGFPLVLSYLLWKVHSDKPFFQSFVKWIIEKLKNLVKFVQYIWELIKEELRDKEEPKFMATSSNLVDPTSDKKDKEEEEFVPQNAELAFGLRFMYENYSSESWYWESVEMVRKVIMTSGLAFIGSQSRIQVGTGAIVACSFAMLHAHVRPIPDPLEHWLQLLSLSITFLNLSIGVMLKIPQEARSVVSDREEDRTGVGIIMIAANVSVIGLVAGRYLWHIGSAMTNFVKEPECSTECFMETCLPLTDVAGRATGGGFDQTMNRQIEEGVDMDVEGLGDMVDAVGGDMEAEGMEDTDGDPMDNMDGTMYGMNDADDDASDDGNVQMFSGGQFLGDDENKNDVDEENDEEDEATFSTKF